MNKKSLDETIKKMVKKELLKEDNSHLKDNMGRLLVQTGDRLLAWNKILNSKTKTVDKDDIKYLIEHLESVIKDLNLFHNNWDK